MYEETPCFPARARIASKVSARRETLVTLVLPAREESMAEVYYTVCDRCGSSRPLSLEDHGGRRPRPPARAGPPVQGARRFSAAVVMPSTEAAGPVSSTRATRVPLRRTATPPLAAPSPL